MVIVEGGVILEQILRWKRQVVGNHFIRSLSVLMAGTALSNILIVATIPILTRMYSPEEFGQLSVFLSILYTVQIITSLRYETAIPLPKKDEDAFHLLVLSSAFAVLMSVLIFISITFFRVDSLFNMPGLNKYMWLLSLSVLGIGLFQVLNLWTIRTEEYRAVSKAKVMMNGGQVSSQVLFGFFHLGILGLLIGEAIGRISGTLAFLKAMNKKTLKIQTISMKKLFSMMKRYKSFPIISSWSAIINSLGTHLPVFYLAAVFDAKSVGFFFLAQKVLTIPEGLLGFSASQVYLSQSSQKSRLTYEEFKSFFWDIVRKMSYMGVGIIGLVVLVAPPVIHIIFGENWKQTGVYIQILAVLYLMRIIVKPIAANFYVFETLKIEMLSESIRFLLICFSIFLSVQYFQSPILSILCISIFSSIGYLIHGLFSWYVMKRSYVNSKKQEFTNTNETIEVFGDA